MLPRRISVRILNSLIIKYLLNKYFLPKNMLGRLLSTLPPSCWRRSKPTSCQRFQIKRKLNRWLRSVHSSCVWSVIPKFTIQLSIKQALPEFPPKSCHQSMMELWWRWNHLHSKNEFNFLQDYVKSWFISVNLHGSAGRWLSCSTIKTKTQMMLLSGEKILNK